MSPRRLLLHLALLWLCGHGGDGGKGAWAVEVDATRQQGPLLAGDFADPFIVRDGNGWLAFATNSGGINVPMAVSSDLVRWRRLAADALPRLPAWARRGRNWAPEVLAVAGGWRLYFTAQERVSGLQCIGVAVARRARGPYRSAATAPLVCRRDAGGSIDASPFRDADGRLYLLFKNDGNRIGVPAAIHAAPLAADGLALAGPATPLIDNRLPWQGKVVEAPTLVRQDSAYLLLFSGGDYGWPQGEALSSYAIGVARCDTPLGPCRAEPAPILASRAAPCLSGPGHQALVRAPDGDRLAFHAWDTVAGCTRGRPIRRLHLAPITLTTGSRTAPPE